MADFVIDAGLKLDATAALSSVKQIGKYIDDAFGKQSKLNVDTAPVEKDIKELGKLAEKTFTDIGDSVGKSFAGSQGGLFDGLKKSFKEGQDVASSGSGIFGSLASSAGQLASPIGLATAALGTFTVAASAAFTEYRALDKNIQNIGTLGVEASGLSLNKFEGLINDLSTRVPDAASNIANGVYNAISAGITGSEETIVGFAEIASKVGVAGLSDTNTAVNALTSVVNAYGTGAAGAKETSDVFFATIKAGKTSFSELNAGLANVIPAASAAGISFQEVGASIAKLTTVGIPTAQATTQIRAAIVELQKPAKPLADALAKIGLNAGNVGAQLKKPASEGGGLINVLQKLEQSATKSGKSMIQIFGSAEAASAALSLTGKNAKTTNDIVQGIKADVSAGVATKAYESAAAGIDVQIGIIKNKVQAVFNNIFSTIKPIANEVFATLVTVFGAIKDALAPVFNTLGKTLGEVFSKIGTVLKPILGVIGGLISVGLVGSITFFASAANLLYTTLLQIFDGIVEAIQPIVVAFKQAFNISDDVSKTFDPLKTLQAIFKALTEAIGDWFAIVGAVVNFLVTVAIEVIKGFVNVILFAYEGVKKTLSVFGLFSDSVKDVGSSAKETGGFFETFIGIIKNAPAIISAITASFKAFTGAIGDLITDFSFDKLKDLITGKTITDAFSGSINTENAKRAADAQVKLFETTIERLKTLNGAAFEEEKTRLLKAVTDKQKILGKANADELTQKINAINLATKAETKAEIAAAAAADEEKKGKLKDIQKEIDKLQKEINATNREAESVARRQETTEAQKAREKALSDLKNNFEKAKEALVLANEETQKEEKVSAKQKLEFKNKTADLILAKETELAAKIAVVNADFAEKERQATLKEADEKLKLQIELAKKKVDLTKERIVGNSDEEKQRLTDLGNFELDLIRVTAQRKFELAVTSNEEVVKADDILKAAIISGNAERVKLANDGYNLAKENALKNDLFIIEQRKVLAADLLIQDKKNELAQQELSISLIKDTAEREKKTKLLEVDKKLLAELEKVKGNERAKTDAQIAAAEERLAIEDEYANKSTTIWESAVTGIASAITGVGDAFKGAFSEQSEAQKQATELAKQENEKQLKDLKTNLTSRKTSFQEYQNQVAQSNAKFNETLKSNTVDFTKLFSDGILKSLDAISAGYKKTADDIGKTLEASAQRQDKTNRLIADRESKLKTATGEEHADLVAQLKKLNDQKNDDEAESASITTQIYSSMALSTAASFGAAIAEGKKNFGEYVILALDALESLVPIISAQIFGLYAASPSPVNVLGLGIPGAVAAAVTTLAFTGLVELAKAGVRSGQGKHDGGYTGDGGEWDVAGVYHKKEYIFSNKAVNGNQVREFDELHNILKGGTNLGAILHAYKYPELSNLSVGANGKLHSNTFTIAPIQYQTNNNSNIISELQNQTNHLSRKLDTVISAQREMPNAFRGKMNVGLEVFHDDSITTKKQALTIKRKALQ